VKVCFLSISTGCFGSIFRNCVRLRRSYRATGDHSTGSLARCCDSAFIVNTCVLLPPPWRRISELALESRDEGFEFLDRMQREYEIGHARFDGEGETLLGAIQNSILLGICGLTRDVYGTDPRVGRVRHLYVRRDSRRRGIGRLLLSEVESRARAHFAALVLRTDSPTAALFYEALGYEALHPSGKATHRRELRQVNQGRLG
jgi:GNAT superfamily N-acetyltransferase